MNHRGSSILSPVDIESLKTKNKKYSPFILFYLNLRVYWLNIIHSYRHSEVGSQQPRKHIVEGESIIVLKRMAAGPCKCAHDTCDSQSKSDGEEQDTAPADLSPICKSCRPASLQGPQSWYHSPWADIGSLQQCYRPWT